MVAGGRDPGWRIEVESAISDGQTLGNCKGALVDAHVLCGMRGMMVSKAIDVYAT
jgi:hypothetical protein